ncbi:hypothetical protein STAFG_3083 [Streptomyces afghaniensis 772]|uniref:Uncharacterized protein n=1 Tax=Streptomyces afghaniensis 772 TaxID=1283301 RepID=S4N0H2_9ACTN|nr:hypothetical protein STAFG_3083 [Streptomyces afghaniensis 772]
MSGQRSRPERIEEDSMAFVTEDNLSDLAVKRWATAHSPGSPS